MTRRHDCDLLSASSGAEGIALARRELPDVVLLNLSLPDMHGAEVLAALRSEPLTATIPVIVISATTAPEDAERALELGAAAYEPKPIDVQRLYDALDSAIAAAPAA